MHQNTVQHDVDADHYIALQDWQARDKLCNAVDVRYVMIRLPRHLMVGEEFSKVNISANNARA
jgi:hypothetical protein